MVRSSGHGSSKRIDGLRVVSQISTCGPIYSNMLNQSPISSATKSFLEGEGPSKSSSSLIITSEENQQQSTDTISHTVSIEKRTEISVFCQDLERHHSERLKSELSYDSTSLFYMKARKKQVIDMTHREVPLSDLLGTTNLTLKHRKMAQVLIARSLLFYPWGNDHSISKHKIFYMGNSENHRYRPFTRLIPSHVNLDNEQEETVEFKSDADTVAPCPTLAEVATLLLELEVGKPIESLRTDDDLDVHGNPTANTDYFTTIRYLEENTDNMYLRIRSAIDTCLQCDFGFDEISLDNREVLDVVYEKVVSPLEEEFEMAFGFELSNSEYHNSDHKEHSVTHRHVTQNIRRTVTIENLTDISSYQDTTLDIHETKSIKVSKDLQGVSSQRSSQVKFTNTYEDEGVSLSTTAKEQVSHNHQSTRLVASFESQT
jgi:hypothetical protein